jgi:hypothetical protein
MTAHIPPLVLNTSGSAADQIIDRLALHLREKFPDVFGNMTLDEINLMFTALRNEIVRLVDTHSHEQEQED